jgi:hypothetical protein
MYDAKLKESEEETEENLQYKSIYDRGYFEKIKGENFFNTKTSYIPNETINLE